MKRVTLNAVVRELRRRGIKFADDKEIKEIIASAVHTWGRLDRVFSHPEWKAVVSFIRRPEIKNNPKFRGVENLKSKIVNALYTAENQLQELIRLLERNE